MTTASATAPYRRVQIDGVVYYTHRVVWEAARGPIPAGHQIHHLNGRRDDNRLENLICVDTEMHARLESPRFRLDADMQWERLCRGCELWLPATVPVWGLDRGRLSGRALCRGCRSSVEAARLRRKQADKLDSLLVAA